MPNSPVRNNKLAVLIGVACFSSSVFAQDFPQDVEVLGEVSARFDGAERQWLTFHVPAEGARKASATASWSRFDTSILPEQPGLSDLGVDPETLSDEERAYLEMMQARLSELQSTVLAELAQDVAISIQAHDPGNPSLLTEGVLTLKPSGWDMTSDDWLDMVGVSVEAEILYVQESAGGLPSVMYSSDGSGDGEIVFDALTFDSPFGRATGSFSSTLCRVEMQGLRITEHPDDCRLIEGSFDTELFAETE